MHACIAQRAIDETSLKFFKKLCTAFVAVMVNAAAMPVCYTQYFTGWVANTHGIETTRVGNVARSVGNDVDSMYGLRAYRRSTGEYQVTKDNYNDASIVLYRWTPPASTGTGVGASAAKTALPSPFGMN